MNKRIASALLATALLGSMSVSAANLTPYGAEAVTAVEGYFNTQSSLDATLISRFSMGGSDEDGGLIEIVTYNTTAQVAYAVAGSAGQLVTIPMTSVTAAGLAGTGVNMAELVGEIEGFVYGDMSSIAINATNTKLAVALQAAGYNDDGMVAIFDVNADGSLAENPTFIPCGKQPDALTFTPDGTIVLVANEGEPREGYGDDIVDPEGSVTLINVAAGTGAKVSFDGVSYDSNVLLKTGSTPAQDFEPEYIACDNNTAYVALQENNAIAVLDIASASFTGVYGLGLQDFGTVALDMVADEVINLQTQDNVYGIYMPDGISMATINGTTYLFTANEGDGREWGDEEGDNFYCNEQKGTTSPTGDVTLDEKVTWFNPADYDMLDQSKAYLYGARSFSIWAVTGSGLSQVYDSGSDFETIVASVLPDYFNCSNDDISLEDRSGKKAIEPEYAAVGVIDGKTYAFIGLERQGGIMVYDVSDPANATFVNYLNSRDYSSDIAGDVAPEGLCFVSATDSATGNALLLAANEVSGTLAVIEMTPYTAPVVEDTPVVEEVVEDIPSVEETAVAPVVTPIVTPVVSTNTYTVQAGDCLWNIASKELGAGARWGEILSLNYSSISSVYGLQVGQELILPTK